MTRANNALVVFASGAVAGVAATIVVQFIARRRKRAAVAGKDKLARDLASLPYEIDHDIDELAAAVRDGTLAPSAAVLELFTARTHAAGAFQRIDGPGNRSGLYKELRISTVPGWAAARRLAWGVCRLLKLAERRTGCMYIAYHTGDAKRVDWPPPKVSGAVRFVFVSDTHLRHRDLPPLPECDVLVHCGDALLQGGDEQPTDGSTGAAACHAQLADFAAWLGETNASAVLLVGGNHDGLLERLGGDEVARLVPGVRFLCGGSACSVHSGDGGSLRVWGCGYSEGHGGANSAWQPTGMAQDEMLASIPTDVDVLITHGPPSLPREPFGGEPGQTFGCKKLLREVTARVNPAVHVFGHDHSAHGATRLLNGRTLFVCATSVVDVTLTAENPPIVLDVPTAARRSG